MGARAHANWLDQLRLFFACAVLFAHSFELVDQREPLERVFPATNLGTLAVCGFFILSGYLISAAWDRAPSWPIFLRNRALRIVPGFTVAFCLSVLIAGAIGSGDPLAYYRELDWPRLSMDLLTLGQPSASFPTPRNYQVNGALWTIQLEFACYLAAPFVLIRRWSLGSAWILCAVLSVLHPSASTGISVAFPRFFLMFLSGAVYWRLRPAYSVKLVIGAALVLPLVLYVPALWGLGIATAGAYLLLTFGLRPGVRSWPDISYGTYLYGWPIQKLLILSGVLNPWFLWPISLCIAMAFGAGSWYLVERYAIRLKSSPSASRHSANLHIQLKH